jgi:hypothetical protein
MIHRTRMLGMIAVSSMALLLPLPVLAEGLTARAELPQVLARAKEWQPDAALVHLSSTKVQAHGSASEWKYSFYSPATKKRCVVTARPGSVTVKEVTLGNDTEPLGEFVDSDKAAEVAAKNGLKGHEPSMSVLRPSGAKASGTRWLVTGGFEAGDTTVTLEAATGAFIVRSVIGG